MVTVDELRTQVERRWSSLDQPSWPWRRDPMDSPAEEEYSRVTDPDRHRVVHERARLWAEVLGELPGVSVERLGPGEISAEGSAPPPFTVAYERGLRVTCDRPGTLPLLLLEREPPRRGPRRPGGQPALLALLGAVPSCPWCRMVAGRGADVLL